MITERENFIRMIRREDAEFIPYQPDLLQMVLPRALGDRPSDHRTGFDWFGVHWSEDPELPMMLVATTGQKPILDDICDWEAVIKWPDLSAIDWAECARRDVPEKDPSKILCAMLVSGPFERLHDLMGFENALCAVITDPEACGAFFSRLCDFKIEQIQYLKKHYDVDMIHFQDDWGSQKDLFFDPIFWRTYIKPHIKRVVNAAHDVGVYFDMHSCGRIDRIIDDIIDMGVEVIDPVQPVNDMARWINAFGRNVIFMGALNAQGVIDYPSATNEDIRREVEAKIDLFAKNGYYIPFAVSLSPKVKDALYYGYLYGKPYYLPDKYESAVSDFKTAWAQQSETNDKPSVVPGTTTSV